MSEHFYFSSSFGTRAVAKLANREIGQRRREKSCHEAKGGGAVYKAAPIYCEKNSLRTLIIVFLIWVLLTPINTYTYFFLAHVYYFK